jgi:hypothetical protein
MTCKNPYCGYLLNCPGCEGTCRYSKSEALEIIQGAREIILAPEGKKSWPES